MGRTIHGDRTRAWPCGDAANDRVKRASYAAVAVQRSDGGKSGYGLQDVGEALELSGMPMTLRF